MLEVERDTELVVVAYSIILLDLKRAEMKRKKRGIELSINLWVVVIIVGAHVVVGVGSGERLVLASIVAFSVQLLNRARERRGRGGREVSNR